MKDLKQRVDPETCSFKVRALRVLIPTSEEEKCRNCSTEYS